MLEQQIDEWIESYKEELLADVDLLVRIPSVARSSVEPKVYGDECAEALDTMLALGAKYGFSTSNAEYRCGVIASDERSGRSVGIWSHLDVVPAGDHWIYPPYQSTRKGDFIIGRGVQDNKGPSMAVLYAMRCIRDLQIPLNYTIKQIIGCAEEAGMQDAVYYVENHEVPDFNFVADSGFPVCYGEKGIIEAELCSPVLSEAIIEFRAGSASNIVPDYAEIVLSYDVMLESKLLLLPDSIHIQRDNGRIKLAAKGKSSHVAFAEGSVNAIHKLLESVLVAGLLEGNDLTVFECIDAICSTNDGVALQIVCADELSGELSCVGAVVRMQLSKVYLTINIRYPITADAQIIMNNLSKAVASKGFTLGNVHVNEANYCDKDTVGVKALNDTYNDVMGTAYAPFVMGGGTYARKIPNAVAFGPGLPADLTVLGLPDGHGSIHAPDEAQSIPNLLTALKIYVMTLIALDRLENF